MSIPEHAKVQYEKCLNTDYDSVVMEHSSKRDHCIRYAKTIAFWQAYTTVYADTTDCTVLHSTIRDLQTKAVDMGLDQTLLSILISVYKTHYMSRLKDIK